MRILREPNLAFKNQPQPIAGDKIAKTVRTIAARAKPPAVDLEFRLGISAGAEAGVAPRKAGRSEDKALGVTVRGAVLGRHVLPPSVPVKALKPLGNKSRSFSKPLTTDGFLPPHLDRKATPRGLPKALARPPMFKQGSYNRAGSQATTIFPPDDRRVFFDTAYPWSCCGRVDTPGGSASGALVGPRHLLTVSHTIQWNSDGSAGWVRFRPMLFDTSTPFGEAWAVKTYFKRKNYPPTLGWIDEQYDYVCVVLDRRIGDLTGWMGAKGYTDSWDGSGYWSHIGYPGDIAGATRPTFQSSIALDGIWYEFDSHEAMSHSADVWPGQSGGPFFGWWNGQSYPSVVAVQSTQNSDENKASGGQDMVDLILQARADFP